MGLIGGFGVSYSDLVVPVDDPALNGGDGVRMLVPWQKTTPSHLPDPHTGKKRFNALGPHRIPADVEIPDVVRVCVHGIE
jgi:hypothetical protein